MTRIANLAVSSRGKDVGSRLQDGGFPGTRRWLRGDKMLDPWGQDADSLGIRRLLPRTRRCLSCDKTSRCENTLSSEFH